MMWYALGAVLVSWVLFNWASPFALLQRAVPLSRGRLPGELLDWDKDNRVRFYVADLQKGPGFAAGLGCSVYAPPVEIIIFDRMFLTQANAPLLRFVIAHELAHFQLGHHKKRWLAVVSLLYLLPSARAWFQRMEDEADAVAEQRTGRKKESFPQLR
jgi:hypothetical protein